MIRLLTGPEKIVLRDAITERYDPFTIKEFTEFRLDKKFFNYTPPFAPFNSQVLEFINQFNMKGWHGQLINAFLSDFPDHGAVQILAFDLGLGPKYYADDAEQTLDRGGLQNLLDSTPFLDVSVLLNEISKLERCVCRVEISLQDGKEKWGTGVLVGKDRVLSNYHVFEDLIEQPGTVNNIVCRFDYNASADGGGIFPGTPVALTAADPVVASSPYSELDVSGSPGLETAWPAEKLDYALVKLEREIANEAFGPRFGALQNVQQTRGYIKPPDTEPNYFNGGHLFIIQHPDKAPKKVAFGFGKVEGTDAASQRVRYKVNTLKGSSGSPCFNEKYQWVALHNMGDPLWNPQYNQGIPVFRIIEDLNKKGKTLA